MPVAFSTPSGSPTQSFNTNLNSAVRGFDQIPTAAPESGSGPNDFPTAIIAYSGQIRAV